MKNTNRLLLTLALSGLATALGSCGSPTSSAPTASSPEASSSEVSSEPASSSKEADDEVSVFVMAGQSNMAGNTQWIGSNEDQKYLEAAMNALAEDERYDVDPADYEKLVAGLPEVKTSFYGYPYGEPYDLHASVPRGDLSDDDYLVAALEGQFDPTRAGMGFKRKSEAKERWMGPELGCAYALSKHATEEKPVYLVKCSFSGSGFHQNNAPTWDPDKGDHTYSLYTDKLKPFLLNNIDLVKEAHPGKKVVVKGFMWHQGESDSGDNVDSYFDNMTKLINTFRSDFAEYGPEQSGDNIAFLDCTIYDGTSSKGREAWSRAHDQADVKRQIEALSDMNFLINGSTIDEDGLNFTIKGDGGDGSAHYCTKDSFRIGLEYAKIIIDNELI